MTHKFETQYHIQEAINHLRSAAANTLENAPADPQARYRADELAGNELLLVADHLENVKTFTRKAVIAE
ncbi:hypothetical protein [Rheinheimera sp. MMS21-TC3]|uniref:hypothetical protein n=1 Tax=Rheinheimera sp. MMS21-TC3 TaxID=3072790 RepID=UPI0028C43836|nr:hypothetical protein [Rheinheimera sp. MMS21-TC3]WNO60869.1 hypothetical protein RDV63_07870 [Rheinheimera sp. MMS21-TC3]